MTELDLAPPVAAVSIFERLGGWRGLADGAIPPVAFVTVNATAGLLGKDEWGLVLGVASALGVAIALASVRLVAGQSLGGVLRGGIGVGFATAAALWTGQARDFFLPGIYVDAVYAAGLAFTAIVGRPAVGYVCAGLFGIGAAWRGHPRLHRVMSLATWGWAAVYLLRTVVQVLFYSADRPELLGLAKVALGWPLTALAVVFTLRAVRRTY